MNKKTNFWDLFELAKEVLTDIELIDNAEFHAQTLSVMTSSRNFEDILSVQLTPKGFNMFMEHVRARAERIGEEVREPFSTHMKEHSDYDIVRWLGVPGLEFMCLKEVSK